MGKKYSIRCFSHQLQLTLVAHARENSYVGDLFDEIGKFLNVVRSCKWHELLSEKQAKKLREALNNNEIKTAHGLNQWLAPIRASDTRWGSHYKSFVSVSYMFDSMRNVLKIIKLEGETSTIMNDATLRTIYLSSFILLLLFSYVEYFGDYTWSITSFAEKRSKYCNYYETCPSHKATIGIDEKGWVGLFYG